jgi:hypothetical protein
MPSAPHPHHHHHSGHVHPPAALTVSLLRLSAWQRLALAAALIVLVWAAALAAI